MFDLIAKTLGFDASPQAATGWVDKPPLDDYWYGPRGAPSSTGVAITEEVAMTYNTVYACVSKIAKTVATLPQFVFERLPDGGKRRVLDHPLHKVLHDQPNPEMDAVSFEEAQMGNVLLWGTRYAEIVRNKSGDVEELWPMESKAVTGKRLDNGDIVYEYRPAGTVIPDILPADRVLAIPGLSLGGIEGLTPIGIQRESIGLGMVATKFGAKLFDNGTVLHGLLETPKKLSKDAYGRLKESFNREFRGWDKAHGTVLLEEDTTYKQVGINPDDAQFLETRGFQAIEICGMFDVPPHKIGILDKATFSNIEEQQIQWVVDNIGPWCRRIEAAKNRQLLGNDPKFFIAHVLEGLLRGDIERRYNAYAQGRMNGWLTTNDIRRLENMNPKTGGDDDYLTPLNMRSGDEPLPNTTNDDRRNNNGRRNRASAMQPVIEDVARRMVTKEVKAIENALKRTARAGNSEGFLSWLDSFYHTHEKDTADNLVPVATAIVGDSGIPAIVERAARKYATDSLAAMRDCAINAPARIPQELNAWLYGKPSKIETLAAEWGRLLE